MSDNPRQHMPPDWVPPPTKPPPNPALDVSARGAANPQTIRALWERVRDRHSYIAHESHDGGWCELCGAGAPCLDYADAVAALDLLSAGLRVGDSDFDLLAINEQLENDPGLYRLVPDPAPRGDERP